MLDDLKILLNSELKIFFSKSYSLELMFLLHENKRHEKGIHEIYETICSPKPKQPSFDNFIQLLVLKNFVYLSANKDKRKKSIQLKKEWSDLLLDLGFRQTDGETFFLYETANLYFCSVLSIGNTPNYTFIAFRQFI